MDFMPDLDAEKDSVLWKEVTSKILGLKNKKKKEQTQKNLIPEDLTSGR